MEQLMTKFTRSMAQKQAARLQACAMLAPQSDEGRKEVIECLLRHCQSEEHAAETMTKFLDGALHVQNLTAELAALARETQRQEEPPVGCQECYLGPDVSTGEVRWAAHVGFERDGLWFSHRCSCPRGRWLAAKDAERAQAKPEKRKPVKPMTPAADFLRRAAGDAE
jgi:hypothetical protein